MRQVVAAIMLVVGMALIVVGVGSATWWKDSPIVEATAETTSQSGIIATDPGVLELVDSTVRVTGRAPGTTVEMVVASTDIAELWLGDEPHASVTGLSSWTALSTEEPDNDAAPEDQITIQGSDLFHPENSIAAEDSAELHFVVPEGDWTLIALGQDGTTPQLSLQWERDVSTPWAVPLAIIGIVLLAAGSALFIYHSQRTNTAKVRAESTERWERQSKADATETSVLPALKSLRHDRREAEAPSSLEPGEERTTVRTETAGSFGAGILPASPRAEEFRSTGIAELTGEEAADEPAESPDAENIEGSADGHDGSDQQAIDEDTGDKADESDVAEGDFAEENVVDSETGEPSSDAAEDSLDDNGAEDETVADDVRESDHVAPDAHEKSADMDSDETDEQASHTGGPRSTSSEWRSLWGFGPKE